MRGVIAALTLALAFVAAAPARDAAAQGYRFAVPEMTLEVFVLRDGSARLAYTIRFENQPGARAIDVVDVGLPHDDYRVRDMRASLDGESLQGIQRSTYIDVGVEVPLRARKIPAGHAATFRFQAVMPDMVYQDTTRDDLASLQVRATWFDPSLVVGPTRLRMAVHLPPGVRPEEVVWHDERWRFHRKEVVGDPAHVVVAWDWVGRNLGPNNPKVGVSFPKRAVARVVTVSAWELFERWLVERPMIRLASALLMAGLLLFAWFRFSGGTGCLFGGVLVVVLAFLAVVSPAGQAVAWLPAAAGAWWVERARRARRTWLPAEITVEGGGIKRGLTAPEAAVVLGLPMERVLTLVLFGLLKKGVLRQVRADPLTVEVGPDFSGEDASRLEAAARRGVVVHDYEQPFIRRFEGGEWVVAQQDLTGHLKELVTLTAKRMAGFDLADTRDYYRRIVARAWKMASGVHTTTSWSNAVDRQLEWLMLDDDWRGHFGRRAEGGFQYTPSWTRGVATTASDGSSGGAGARGSTSLGEVASSFAGWAESTASGLVSSFDGGAIPAASQGLVDLGGLDTATGQFFEALASSGGGGGGGGGCACACAGCACACACAGGGR